VPVVGLVSGLTDPVSGLNMGQTAEVLVRDFGITRREQDEFALLSHQRWTAANEAGKFRNEIVPFYPPPKFEAVEEDIGPRKTNPEAWQTLPILTGHRHGHSHSSPITDGAAER
jgi:acetyl-CoA acetyltransferase